MIREGCAVHWETHLLGEWGYCIVAVYCWIGWFFILLLLDGVGQDFVALNRVRRLFFLSAVINGYSMLCFFQTLFDYEGRVQLILATMERISQNTHPFSCSIDSGQRDYQSQA
jgi:hypothetical protein